MVSFFINYFTNQFHTFPSIDLNVCNDVHQMPFFIYIYNKFPDTSTPDTSEHSEHNTRKFLPMCRSCSIEEERKQTRSINKIQSIAHTHKCKRGKLNRERRLCVCACVLGGVFEILGRMARDHFVLRIYYTMLRMVYFWLKFGEI